MRTLVTLALAWLVVAFVASAMGLLDMPWAREATREAARLVVLR